MNYIKYLLIFIKSLIFNNKIKFLFLLINSILFHYAGTIPNSINDNKIIKEVQVDDRTYLYTNCIPLLIWDEWCKESIKHDSFGKGIY